MLNLDVYPEIYLQSEIGSTNYRMVLPNMAVVLVQRHGYLISDIESNFFYSPSNERSYFEKPETTEIFENYPASDPYINSCMLSRFLE